jgi:enterochelin esterase family protein
MPVTLHTFESALLRGNPLGDTPVRRIPVYLPEAAFARTGARFPVLYALAGFTGTGLSFLNYDFYQPNLPDTLDALIATGEMPPCVVVMVDGMTALGGNQYVDSPAVGPWARHVTEELVPWAEETLPVLRGREHRGVFGKSSGGYGALMMALEHAETFAAAASHSGDCYFEYCYGADFPGAIDALRKAGGLEGWQAGWRHHPRLPSSAFPAVNIVAMSAFYSPAPGRPGAFDLPFDLETGEIRADVFARWKTRDPVELVARQAEALRSLKLLFFDCGSRDEYHLHHGNRILHTRLNAAGVPHVYETFDDGHRGIGYRVRASLPRLVNALTPGS